ncbi:MAG: YdcH family protein [Gammaproteobacteria bacterium]|nr:YdcH family protein [Gammaproteobacteria bacterium]MBY0468146.1 YdcH family protein [Burkholderiaceae bacterium]
MVTEETKSIQRRILELQTEHRDLDEVVTTLSNRLDVDQLLLRRMKKRKLQLKDQIARLKSQLIPDLDA